MNGILSTDDEKLATVYLDLIPVTGIRLEYLHIEMHVPEPIHCHGIFVTNKYLVLDVLVSSEIVYLCSCIY